MPSLTLAGHAARQGREHVQHGRNDSAIDASGTSPNGWPSIKRAARTRNQGPYCGCNNSPETGDTVPKPAASPSRAAHTRPPPSNRSTRTTIPSGRNVSARASAASDVAPATELLSPRASWPLLAHHRPPVPSTTIVPQRGAMAATRRSFGSLASKRTRSTAPSRLSPAAAPRRRICSSWAGSMERVGGAKRRRRPERRVWPRARTAGKPQVLARTTMSALQARRSAGPAGRWRGRNRARRGQAAHRHMMCSAKSLQHRSGGSGRSCP